MPSPREAYDELKALKLRQARFGSIGSVLGWDMRTKMPPKGAAHRGEQLKLLAGMGHDLATNPRIGELLAMLEGSEVVADPLSVEAVNAREWRRDYDHATKLPKALVEEMSATSSKAYGVWVQARKDNDFASFRPLLEKHVDLARQKADALGWTENRYDALLDLYEPGAKASDVKKIFDPLQKDLAALIAEVAAAGKAPNPKVKDSDYSVEAQEALCIEAAKQIGFDFEAGRLDTTVHPFCSTFGPGDSRLTTRYNPRCFGDALFGTLHEAGHGLYGQGQSVEHYGTPMGRSVGLGIHESQSRMWENLVGRSRGYWEFFLPTAVAKLPALKAFSIDEILFAINESKPSLIRVEADESTYNLHIILRFNLELQLINGELKAADVPAAWKAAMKELLGQDVPDDRLGCLQDTHWSGGSFGYFPTYALGNLYASQFFETINEELGDQEAAFAKGEFAPLLAWLRKNIHQEGMRRLGPDLVKHLTGAELSHKPLMRHLRKKLGPLYGV